MAKDRLHHRRAPLPLQHRRGRSRRSARQAVSRLARKDSAASQQVPPRPDLEHQRLSRRRKSAYHRGAALSARARRPPRRRTRRRPRRRPPSAAAALPARRHLRCVRRSRRVQLRRMRDWGPGFGDADRALLRRLVPAVQGPPRPKPLLRLPRRQPLRLASRGTVRPCGRVLRRADAARRLAARRDRRVPRPGGQGRARGAAALAQAGGPGAARLRRRVCGRPREAQGKGRRGERAQAAREGSCGGELSTAAEYVG
mmetsp:Transcript_51072/g.164963  ORF Transcript_51072/g.164963 Transcript_51072/m.164963 type:complete len:256 (-) Transcript_51072:196-963(-)